MAEFGISSKKDLIEKAKSSQFLIVIVASIIVSASLIGIKILWAQRSYQAQIIDAKDTANDMLDSNIAAVDGLSQSFDDLENSDINSSLVLDALPSKYDYPALATTIEKMTALSGVKLESFVADDMTATAVNSLGQPLPVPIPFTISVGGDYKSIQTLISNLNKSIRPFQINDFILSSGEGGNMGADLSIVTYYMPAKSLEIRKTQITSGAAPAATLDANGNPITTPVEVPAGVDTTGATTP